MNNRMKTNKETIKEPRRILSKPLSVREQWALCDEDAYLEGIVSGCGSVHYDTAPKAHKA